MLFTMFFCFICDDEVPKAIDIFFYILSAICSSGEYGNNFLFLLLLFVRVILITFVIFQQLMLKHRMKKKNTEKRISQKHSPKTIKSIIIVFFFLTFFLCVSLTISLTLSFKGIRTFYLINLIFFIMILLW